MAAVNAGVPSALLVPNLNLSGTPSGTSRIGSYADLGKTVIGAENLAAWWKAVRTSTSVYNIIGAGDSTMGAPLNAAGDAAYTPATLIATLLRAKGYIVAPVTRYNAGKTTADWLVPTTGYLDLDLAAYTGAAIPKLMFINYGINDPYFSISPATTAANLRTGFARIRATTGWDRASVSLAYVMPVSTYDDAGGRNEAWHEAVRPGVAQACRDYGVAFFDTYSWLRDVRNSATGWISSDTIHPSEDYNLALYGAVADLLIPRGLEGILAMPRAVTPASGYTLPTGTEEPMRTQLSGGIALGSGYILKTTPSTLAAGVTLFTVAAQHWPAYTIYAYPRRIPLVIYDGSAFTAATGTMTTAGVVTLDAAVGATVSRVCFGSGAVWAR